MPSQLQKQQCYLVYGNNFKPVKKGFKPKYSCLNNKKYKKSCKKKPTKY